MKELLSRTKERASVVLTGAAVALMSASAFAQEASIGDLADAITFDDVAPGVIGAAGALIGLYVIIKGVRIIISFVRSA